MYRFYSSVKKTVLDKKYKAIYATAGLQSKWTRELASCPELAQTMPAGIVPDDMLTMPYEDLVDVYLQYRKVYDRLTDDRKTVLTAAASKVFTYDSYKRKIANFLLDSANGFEIHNCVYCDLVDARLFGRGRRQFDTEHILDKGECPLVGLSLYNFCPACGVCNTNCKGTQTIGSTSAEMKKLGPTSKRYDFESQVKFVLIEKPEALGMIKVGHLDWYDVDFEYKDPDYQIVVNLFDLKSRYNLDQNKLKAVEWRALAKKSQGIVFTLTAWVHGNSIERERELVFHLDEHRKAHSERLKLMKDMMIV